MEAIRQLCLQVGYENSLIIHLTLLPFIHAAGEMKTKPTQHSVMQLREIGLQPGMLVCRTENNHHLSNALKKKLGLFCNVDVHHVFESPDVETIYEIPLVLYNQGFDNAILKRLRMDLDEEKHRDIEYLEKFIRRFKNPQEEVTIAMCGKYNTLHDAYKSILEAFIHAGVENNTRVRVKWVDTENLCPAENSELPKEFESVNGILIPGGFGHRGIEGKIIAAGIARRFGIPFFGICLGLQCAVIDFSRNVCGMSGANSTEFNKRTKHPVIALMPDQRKIRKKGATMRLGDYPCEIKHGTKASTAYEKRIIHERHRHRFEVNNIYRQNLESEGLIFSGVNKELGLVEMIELPDHPWFVGVQFHPELKSRVIKAHPLFRDFIHAAVTYKNKIGSES